MKLHQKEVRKIVGKGLLNTNIFQNRNIYKTTAVNAIMQVQIMHLYSNTSANHY